MCEGAVCLFNVSEVDNYSLNMTGCSTISIRGEAYAGEREISFQYNFTCDLDPPVPKTQEALLLLRGLEMKIQLHSHEKSSVVETVELSCFSHLNDSRDVPVSFHLVRGTSTLSVPCPVDSNTTEDTNYTLGCVSPIQGGDWQICRNKSSPYNCYLILHDFDDSDSGNYTCSTNITGKEILSNELDLQALKLLGPAEKPRSKSHSPSSKVVLGLGIGIGVLLLLLLLMVLVLNAVRSYQRARNDRYQRLFEQDHEDINTPGTSSGTFYIDNMAHYMFVIATNTLY
ncbi:hypothetical protein GBAR_LOCUS2675 [Geodia barretti]|uniref:Ig-like domain-containing protein n=1 Tax=Geodia barretti TaxID=519541 RepID=A0AA35W595_GEOBA|nr:hypothetical protein GBAR_LOCUS2675 [Geodia barretti]